MNNNNNNNEKLMNIYVKFNKFYLKSISIKLKFVHKRKRFIKNHF